jgi:hypothetical protein
MNNSNNSLTEKTALRFPPITRAEFDEYYREIATKIPSMPREATVPYIYTALSICAHGMGLSSLMPSIATDERATIRLALQKMVNEIPFPDKEAGENTEQAYAARNDRIRDIARLSDVRTLDSNLTEAEKELVQTFIAAHQDNMGEGSYLSNLKDSHFWRQLHERDSPESPRVK